MDRGSWIKLKSYHDDTSSNGNIFLVTDLCAGNSPVTGEFPSHRPVTQSFGVFFDLLLNEPLGKQSWGWWFETPSRSLWRLNMDCCLWLYIDDTMIEKQMLNFRCGDSSAYFAGITLGMGSSNERRRYNVIFSVIDWAHTQNDPCYIFVIININEIYKAGSPCDRDRKWKYVLNVAFIWSDDKVQYISTVTIWIHKIVCTNTLPVQTTSVYQ